MAKVTAPLMSMDASGTINKTIVFLKGGVARIWVKPANPQTVAQMLNRNRMGDIQRSLAKLGLVLRTELKSAFGYRWNTLIIQHLMATDAANLQAYNAEFDAFAAQGKTDWATADTSAQVLLDDGVPLYACAKAVKAVAVALGVTIENLTAPVEANSATVGAEWIANA